MFKLFTLVPTPHGTCRLWIDDSIIDKNLFFDLVQASCWRGIDRQGDTYIGFEFPGDLRDIIYGLIAMEGYTHDLYHEWS